jgi:uncharacterized protein (TIGR03083 family)
VDLTAPPPPEDEMTRLVLDALVAAETEPAPPPLRARVLAAAQDQRPAGRPRGVTPLSPVEGYRRTVDELDDLLTDCDAADWAAVVDPYRWTVQGLVGHVLAVERLLATRLGVDHFEVPAALEADHLAATEETVAAQDGRDPAGTLAEWRSAARRLSAALASGVDLDARVSIHDVTLRWHDLLVVRCLEVWTHTDDIRRATGRPIVPPDEERMALMTDLAVRSLPSRLAAADEGPDAAGTARIVLTGSGGGVWFQAFGPGGAAAEPDVRIVADAVGFCRLTAGRLRPDELGAGIVGDRCLGAAILDVSAAFAV